MIFQCTLCQPKKSRARWEIIINTLQALHVVNQVESVFLQASACDVASPKCRIKCYQSYVHGSTAYRTRMHFPPAFPAHELLAAIGFAIKPCKEALRTVQFCAVIEVCSKIQSKFASFTKHAERINIE